MTTAIIILFVTQLLLPAVLIAELWRSGPSSKVSWLAGVLGSGAFVSYFLLTGRWDWTSYYVRGLVLVAFLCAAYVSLRRTFGAKAPWWHTPASLSGWSSLIVNVFLAAVFAYLTALAVQGFGYGGLRAVDLSFPLEGGASYVAQGGNSPRLNYHNVDRAQRFALDVAKLNPAGTRASGVYPSDPTRYAAFGEEVYSPCAGEVTEAVDGREDLSPPEADGENLAGNHVVLGCKGVEVLLAHLKEGSVAAERGEKVEEGQLLGRIGNSGNTTEPHLHIHAARSGPGETILEGEGVPIRFDGRFMVRNSLAF